MERFKVEATISGSKVIYERYFDVIPELVFKAWASPEELSQWWGPDGFSLTTVSMEFRDGGLWDFVMHGPDGTDYKNRVKFLEILEPSRIVSPRSKPENSRSTEAPTTSSLRPSAFMSSSAARAEPKPPKAGATCFAWVTG